MTAVWPATVPGDFLLGHTQGPPANLVAFQPHSGAPALYQSGDSPVRRVQGRVRISNAQLVTFLTFFESTLAWGSRRFTLDSPSFDGAEWLCQFDADGPYQLEAAGAGWWLQVALVLVRRIS